MFGSYLAEISEIYNYEKDVLLPIVVSDENMFHIFFFKTNHECKMNDKECRCFEYVHLNQLI